MVPYAKAGFRYFLTLFSKPRKPALLQNAIERSKYVLNQIFRNSSFYSWTRKIKFRDVLPISLSIPFVSQII